MKHLFIYLLTCIILISCNDTKEISSINPINWQERFIDLSTKDSLTNGSSYLSVYSEIYSMTEHRTINLTATVSLRNISVKDSVFILNADYYNTHGDLIRNYFKKPIYIKPLETLEIIIDEKDSHGGSGANFIFDWKTHPNNSEPHFEAVMISTSGQQGISFTTQGIKL
ncbi:DUF3124 domain-containing protein [Corallibacter sp.]|uniref:DUF3124 domain-containing protein n=1 Tax=Corallibacter sp. TaxID=2038084 RepID=UPI003A944AE9